MADLGAKSELVSSLQVQVETLQTRLDESLGQANARTTEFEQLQRSVADGEAARAKLEASLQALNEAADQAAHNGEASKQAADEVSHFLLGTSSISEHIYVVFS